MKRLLLIIFLSVTYQLSAQVTPKSLVGEWTTSNSDSSYYKNDTIELHQDITYNNQPNCCDYVTWRVNSKKSLFIENLFNCTEPGRVKRSADKETFSIKNANGQQVIEIKRGGKKVDRFQILELKESRVNKYPYDIKVLKLKRLKF